MKGPDRPHINWDAESTWRINLEVHVGKKQSINWDRIQADLENPEIQQKLLLSIEQKHS